MHQINYTFIDDKEYIIAALSNVFKYNYFIPSNIKLQLYRYSHNNNRMINKLNKQGTQERMLSIEELSELLTTNDDMFTVENYSRKIYTNHTYYNDDFKITINKFKHALAKIGLNRKKWFYDAQTLEQRASLNRYLNHIHVKKNLTPRHFKQLQLGQWGIPLSTRNSCVIQ